MISIIKMPKYGVSMEEGLICSWLIREGESVKKGDPIAEVESEKINNTIEAAVDGVLRKIVAQEGETLACGEPMGIIASSTDEDITGMLAAAKQAKGALAEAGVKKAAAEVPPGSEPASEIKITPRALKLAEDKGVDYSKISGTGIAGAITRNDIKQYLSEQGDAVNKSSMSSVRKTIYRRMMTSLSRTAQTTMAMDVEVSALVKAYRENKPLFREDGIKLSYTGIIIKAMAGALKNHPILCTSISEEQLLRTSPEINIGIAVDVEGGLTVPVLKKAGQKDLRTICREVEDLSGRAKARTLAADDLSGGTMTITNLGMFDIKYFTPILNFPESAILGVGAIVEEPVVKEGSLHVGNVMALSLTHDHRLIDGAPAARFLMELKGLLMNPKELF